MFPQHATPSSPQRFLPFLSSLKRLLQLQACVCTPSQGLELSPGPNKHAILFNPCHTLEGELWQFSCSQEDRLGKDKCSQHLLNGDPRPALCWTLCPHPALTLFWPCQALSQGVLRLTMHGAPNSSARMVSSTLKQKLGLGKSGWSKTLQ